MNEHEGFEYAMFVIRRWKFDRVVYPDGATEDSPQTRAGKDRKRLRARFDKDVLPGLQDAWRAGYPKWRQQLTTTEHTLKMFTAAARSRVNRPTIRIHSRNNVYELKPDPGSKPAVYKVVVSSRYGGLIAALLDPPNSKPIDLFTVPDSEPIAAELNFDTAKRLLVASLEPVFQRLYKHDTDLTKAYDQAFIRWETQVKVRTGQRGWRAAFYTSSNKEQIDINDSAGESGWPEAAVIETLNRLGGDEWRVVSVTEDKGLYAGNDANEESGPVAVRYLLVRSIR